MDIIMKASHAWKKIADLICSDPNRTSAVQQQYTNPDDCLRQILLENFINNEPEDYRQDWSGLIELLGDAVGEVLAEEVEYAIAHKSCKK